MSKYLCIFPAIYLAKRTMRNKQKHGLEEYEQVRVKSSIYFIFINRNFILWSLIIISCHCTAFYVHER